MAYCSEEDILQMLPQAELAELSAESGDTPDPEVVADAIAKADGEIDSYLAMRYAVPLNPVPARVKALSVDLAIYHLYSRRSVVPTVRWQKYADAIAFLKEAAAGRTRIEGASGEPPTTPREVAEVESAARLFTRRTQGDW
jgi:phage gp36-like protein